MRIGVLGMGGIGSFIGAHLATNYESDPHTDIVFICRGKTKEAILANGLALSTPTKTFTAKPDLTSDDPAEIGLLDLLIVSTKSYDVTDAIREYSACISKNTIIIPLQNVVNPKELIKSSIGYHSTILEGCIYIASNIEKPGVVKHVGGPGKIFFGNDDDEDFQRVEQILQKGGIDATYTHQIKTILWKKYLFVSPIAAITTALAISFGELAEKAGLMVQLEGMMNEVQRLANQFNVTLTQTDIADSLAMLKNFPYQAKSSLQLDVENQTPKTEKPFLVDFIIKNGEKYRVKVDIYDKMNQKIQARISNS